MTTRGARAVKASAVALFATYVATFSHAAGGGGQPHVAALALALAFSLPLSVVLLRRRFSHLALAVAIAATQAAYHSLFALFGEAPVISRGPVGATAGHHHGMTAAWIPSESATAGVAIAPTPEMVVAHLLAALATFGFVIAAQGAVLRTLARAVVSSTGLLARLLPGLRAVALVAGSPARRAVRRCVAPESAPARFGARSIASGFLRHRGPPALHHA